MHLLYIYILCMIRSSFSRRRHSLSRLILHIGLPIIIKKINLTFFFANLPPMVAIATPQQQGKK